MSRREGGFGSAVGLLSMVVSMIVVAVLLLIATHTFGGGTTGSGAGTSNASILSSSSAETQLKLCAEGRDSSYGRPPSPAQQAKCVNQLAGQIAGGGAGVSDTAGP